MLLPFNLSHLLTTWQNFTEIVTAGKGKPPVEWGAGGVKRQSGSQIYGRIWAFDQSMWAAKKPLRAPTYFCNPRSHLRSRSATSRSKLRSAHRFCATPAHRSAPPDFGSTARSAPRSAPTIYSSSLDHRVGTCLSVGPSVCLSVKRVLCDKTK